MDSFLNNSTLERLEAQARAFKDSGQVVSDLIDQEGHQYVDLVQEGGGVLGIGLVGYTYILERAGIRFYSLAGTSAGSINTLLIASLAKVGQPVSREILKALSEQDLFEFVDGPRGIKKLIQKQIEGRGSIIGGLVWNALTIFRSLGRKLGINPGEKFTQWITVLLKQAGIRSMNDLVMHRQKRPSLRLRGKSEPMDKDPGLAIVASEVNTHTKVDFPRMAKLYWRDPGQINPAKFVRASMSIPFFFYPFYIKDNIPDAGQEDHPAWAELAGYHGPVPPSVRFVDGGMLSNFPINIFHVSSGLPTRPTFGVRLSTYRDSYSKTDTFFGLSGAMISTMRQIHDYDFILRNPDYNRLICNINADQEFNWLNFAMTRERQVELFLLGAKKGMEFIQSFDWEAYKEVRRKLAEV